MKIRVALEVDVDEESWATDYHLAPGEVEADVIGHLPEIVTEAAQAKARQLGTFSVVNLGTLQVLPDGKLRRVA